MVQLIIRKSTARLNFIFMTNSNCTVKLAAHMGSMWNAANAEVKSAFSVQNSLGHYQASKQKQLIKLYISTTFAFWGREPMPCMQSEHDKGAKRRVPLTLTMCSEMPSEYIPKIQVGIDRFNANAQRGIAVQQVVPCKEVFRTICNNKPVIDYVVVWPIGQLAIYFGIVFNPFWWYAGALELTTSHRPCVCISHSILNCSEFEFLSWTPTAISFGNKHTPTWRWSRGRNTRSECNWPLQHKGKQEYCRPVNAKFSDHCPRMTKRWTKRQITSLHQHSGAPVRHEYAQSTWWR